jgi:hypothetical protein
VDGGLAVVTVGGVRDIACRNNTVGACDVDIAKLIAVAVCIVDFAGGPDVYLAIAVLVHPVAKLGGSRINVGILRRAVLPVYGAIPVAVQLGIVLGGVGAGHPGQRKKEEEAVHGDSKAQPF